MSMIKETLEAYRTAGSELFKAGRNAHGGKINAIVRRLDDALFEAGHNEVEFDGYVNRRKSTGMALGWFRGIRK